MTLKINKSIYVKKTKAPLEAGDIVVWCKGRWNDRVKKAIPKDSNRIAGVYIGKKGKKEQVTNDFEFINYFGLDQVRL